MNRMILPGAIALALVAGLVWWLTARPEPETAIPAGTTATQPADDTLAEDVDTSSIIEMTLGDPDAPVTVVEYASFTCPHCANFHDDQFKRLKADYIDTGKVRFVFRDVYFDRLGLWASMVARCGGTDRFFGIAGMLFDQQRKWIGDGQDPVAVADRLRKIGKAAGLDNELLDACLADNDKARTLVTWYQQHAEADGISSTPSLVIDGEKHSNMAYDELKALIDKALAQ